MMTAAQFVDAIADILGAAPGSVCLETSLDDIQGYDSLGRVSIIALMDEQFAYSLESSLLRRLKTVGDVYALVGG